MEQIKLADLSGNIYRNWHKPTKEYKTKKRFLHSSLPINVMNHANTGIKISFFNDDGNKISIVLTRETAEHLAAKLIEHLSNRKPYTPTENAPS